MTMVLPIGDVSGTAPASGLLLDRHPEVAGTEHDLSPGIAPRRSKDFTYPVTMAMSVAVGPENGAGASHEKSRSKFKLRVHRASKPALKRQIV